VAQALIDALLRSHRSLRHPDWTRAFAVVNYEQAVEPFLKTDRLSASGGLLMGGATTRLMAGRQRKVSTLESVYRGAEVAAQAPRIAEKTPPAIWSAHPSTVT